MLSLLVDCLDTNDSFKLLQQQQQVELAKAQMQGQQKGNSLNFQPEKQQQQQLQFQKNLDSLGHQQFFPEQQKIVPPGAAGGLQNGIDNMNAVCGYYFMFSIVYLGVSS